MWVVGFVALLITACAGQPVPSHSPTPIAAGAPVNGVAPDVRFTPIDSLTLNPDREVAHITFVGAKEFVADDPCSVEYAATTRVEGTDLHVGVFKSRSGLSLLPDNVLCTLEGHFRFLDVLLEAPFDGSTWHDLAGYKHFLTAPADLVEFDLPDGWSLVGQRDIEGSPTGRWERTYARIESAPPEQTLVIIQSFGGPIGVSGGEVVTHPSVNGRQATLYRHAPIDGQFVDLPTGELVLTWALGKHGLAMVAYESEFSAEQLISLAETGRPPTP